MIRRAFVLLLLLSGPASAVSNPSELLPDRAAELRAEQIGHQLRCLVCQNESVEESDASLARDLRRIIRERVMAGDDDKQITAWMVARYGDFVRLRPPFKFSTLALWLSPFAALAIGLAAAVAGMRRRGEAPAPLSEAESRKVAELLRP
jgi:cytochrome c-type biogenesis protein CcmH